MKNIVKKIQTAATAMIFSLILTIPAIAQDPPPPPPDHGSSGNVPGGGATVGSGLLIMSMFGVAYGAAKAFSHKKMLRKPGNKNIFPYF